MMILSIEYVRISYSIRSTVLGALWDYKSISFRMAWKGVIKDPEPRQIMLLKNNDALIIDFDSQNCMA